MKKFDCERIREEALKEHERLSTLYKENKFMFEIENKKKIEKFIKEAPAAYQPKLREIQDKWDKTMKSAGSKHNRIVLAEAILMEQFHEVFNPALQWAAKELKNLTA